MQIEYAKVSALGDRTDNQDRAAVVVAEDAALAQGGHRGQPPRVHHLPDEPRVGPVEADDQDPLGKLCHSM